MISDKPKDHILRIAS